MAKIVLEQVLKLYQATPELQKAFPSDKYKLTLFEKLDIYNLIRMYENAGKDFGTKQKQTNSIQNAIQTNLIKTSLPQKLERIDWNFARLKDLIRFTIEKDDFGTIQNLVQDSIKLTNILANLEYKIYEVDAKYDEGTKYSDITLQYINENQPNALNPNGTIIEVKFQSKAGMLAKKLEDPIYHKRRSLAEQIRQLTRSQHTFDESIEELNTYFGHLISQEENLNDESLNKFLVLTSNNSDFESLKPKLQQYCQLLKQSKEIFKNVPAVVNSRQSAEAFETLFKFQNSQEGRHIVKQKELKASKQAFDQKLATLRVRLQSHNL